MRGFGVSTLFIAVCLFSAPVAGQDSLLQVVAEPGDGIFSLLRKHGADPARHLEDFIALNQPHLGEGKSLYEGATYLIPLDLSESTERPSAIADDPARDPEAPKSGPGIESGAVVTPPDGSGAPESTTPVPSKSDEKPSSDFPRYEIFGEKYAEIRPESTRLEGTVYYLVSGHGGPDPGAMTQYNGQMISEDEYAYDVTLRLARNLLAHGAVVHIIIRDPDDGIRDDRVLKMDRDEVALPQQEIPLNQLARLRQRVEVVNRLYLENKGKHQRLIVTHVDSRSKGQNIDVFFYHHNKSRSGKKLAEHIHKTFQAKYAYYQPGRNYSGTFEDRSTLYLVKNTLPATAFIEIGNIRNERDQRRILDPDNRQALANWICEGVLADYEDR
ncbi:N-acetylmuramoyl-L-alanine amidase [Robiginitalea sp. SC105]|uniref:N-acetylmuramoyl-L-alanine amidase family protein n=1 Tax=Robiginitalea sp. SC105 TaxID=2762332 RepID=UPI00163971F8|nr:N-acetylmuramoyl-L-alanine amidase [Robiginitalea sp. SC105]MBC2837823.1 N-acetylmuramoyl-L-alanine amidase [Robiginitalea sp. SC105]